MHYNRMHNCFEQDILLFSFLLTFFSHFILNASKMQIHKLYNVKLANFLFIEKSVLIFLHFGQWRPSVVSVQKWKMKKKMKKLFFPSYTDIKTYQ